MSKFGSLAEACADNPGTYLGTDEAREEGAPEHFAARRTWWTRFFGLG
ncbi:hypothetical protein [Streptomyces sp. NPDC014746]